MPKYRFVCNQCKEEFVEKMSMQEKNQQTVECPECSSEQVSQQFSNFSCLSGTPACGGGCSSCSGCGH